MTDKAFKPGPPRPPAAQVLGAIASESIGACDPREAVRRAVRAGDEEIVLGGRAIPLRKKGRFILIACGKAAAGMTAGLLEIVTKAGGCRRVEGVVAEPAPPAAPRAAGGRAGRRANETHEAHEATPPGVVDLPPLPRDRFRIARLSGGHPLPSAASFGAARAALRLAGGARAGDDVVYLVSGGGSAIMAAPLPPFINAAEKIALHRLLLVSGAGIGSINAVRKHLSAIKGGRLAVAARRAGTQTTLILCDVDPERAEEVASDPSLPDRTTLGDFVAVIDRYGLAPALPVKVLEALRRRKLPETPKPRDPTFRRSRSMVLMSNRELRGAAVRAGLSRGLPTEGMPGEVTLPVEDAVEMVARAIESAPPGTRLLVLGGEVRTAPTAPGLGGRAQEFALRLAVRMAGLGSRPWAFLALGSDGIDGNSPAAGAYTDGTTLERARRAGLDPSRFLRDADSWRFFNTLNDAITTGPTGTNLGDLYLLLTGEVGAPRPR
jgi:glycerate-2-kinase